MSVEQAIGRAAAKGIVPVLVGMIMVAVCGGCGRKGGAAEARKERTAKAVPVVLRPVRVESVQRMVEVIGTLYGEEEAVISAKVPGKIKAIYKDMGDRARPGEAMAQIDPVDYQLACRQKELAMREPLAKLGLSQVPGDDFDPARVPMVKRAKLQAENAHAKYERGKQLHEQNPPMMSEQDFQDLKTAADVARSDYEVALLTARGLLSEARTKQAELEIARQRLADTVVRTPQMAAELPGGNGRTYAVSARKVSVGEYVKEGAALFEVVSDDPIKLRGAVREQFVGQIQVGQKVDVAVAAYPERVFVGEVVRINPQISEANRMFEIEAVIPNGDRLLRPGAFARAWVKTRVEAGVVFVPQEAVLSFAGVNKVFTVKDGRAVEAVVELGESRGDWVEVVKGVRGEASVVVVGQSKLSAGVAVEVREAAAATQSVGDSEVRP